MAGRLDVLQGLKTRTLEEAAEGESGEAMLFPEPDDVLGTDDKQKQDALKDSIMQAGAEYQQGLQQRVKEVREGTAMGYPPVAMVPPAFPFPTYATEAPAAAGGTATGYPPVAVVPPTLPFPTYATGVSAAAGGSGDSGAHAAAETGAGAPHGGAVATTAVGRGESSVHGGQ